MSILPSSDDRVAHSTYAALVKADADMTGHVAYALYKRDKLKFCEAYNTAHSRQPSTEALDVFIQSTNLPTRLAAYRSEAEEALEGFAQEVLDVTLEKERAAMNQQLIAELKAARSFGRAVWENLVANILALAVGALIVAIIYGTRIGFVPMIADMFGYDVKEKPIASSSSAPTPQVAPAASR